MLRTGRETGRAGRDATLPQRTALVLAGGKSLGAFEAGAYAALHDNGIRPDWVVGSSIGAINGAIIAGNPAERRVEALRKFWSKAALPSPVWRVPGYWEEIGRRWIAEMQASMFGNPALFRPNRAALLGWLWPAPSRALGMFDLAPLRKTLQELVDFQQLNRGDVRFSVVAVDLETGEEVVFDTERDRIGPEHIMASGAMLGEFRPIRIDERLLGDGALQSNLPVDVILREAEEDLVCFAIDLFSTRGHRIRNIPEAVVRREELELVSHSRHLLEAHESESRLRRMLKALLDLVPEELNDHQVVGKARAEAARPEITIARIAWRSAGEVGLNTYDWSERTLTKRWEAGAEAALDGLSASENGRAPGDWSDEVQADAAPTRYAQARRAGRSEPRAARQTRTKPGVLRGP